MALKDFMAGRERSEETGTEAPRPAAAPAQPASRPAARTVAPSTCIDATSQFAGQLHCRETLRIDGAVEGEIRCEKNVIVGEGAKIRASIEAAEVSIAGEIKGDIMASRKITLESTARVIGDLQTPGIVIEEGAKLEGRIMIGREAGAQADEAKRAAAAEPKAPAAQKPAPKSPPPPSAAV